MFRIYSETIFTQKLLVNFINIYPETHSIIHPILRYCRKIEDSSLIFILSHIEFFTVYCNCDL